jgi:hypothetical protein
MQGHLKWTSGFVDADKYGTDRRQTMEQRAIDHPDARKAAVRKCDADERSRHQPAEPRGRIVQAGRGPGPAALRYDQHKR